MDFKDAFCPQGALRLEQLLLSIGVGGTACPPEPGISKIVNPGSSRTSSPTGASGKSGEGREDSRLGNPEAGASDPASTGEAGAGEYTVVQPGEAGAGEYTVVQPGEAGAGEYTVVQPGRGNTLWCSRGKPGRGNTLWCSRGQPKRGAGLGNPGDWPRN